MQLLAVVSGAISLPFAILFIFTDKFTISGILLSILSGLIHVFYFYFLGTAYKKADLSFVYPIARGTAVALVPIMGMLLIKGISFDYCFNRSRCCVFWYIYFR